MHSVTAAPGSPSQSASGAQKQRLPWNSAMRFQLDNPTPALYLEPWSFAAEPLLFDLQTFTSLFLPLELDIKKSLDFPLAEEATAASGAWQPRIWR
jgi:hypothetical protein